MIKRSADWHSVVLMAGVRSHELIGHCEPNVRRWLYCICIDQISLLHFQVLTCIRLNRSRADWVTGVVGVDDTVCHQVVIFSDSEIAENTSEDMQKLLSSSML
ncbi:hypothetical protein OUZ56_020402 [Daphnia magna]|uniref:Uncharacterized protein n=1 Tax=Daphnia magna TaxID=35525 RepID=A0ABQ9ZF51_9CRUS|nr:hypothetical protein OUZ56_020402 [Daphnia magna]